MRTAMPMTTMNPTMEPNETRPPPVARAATAPPDKAAGRLRKRNAASDQFLKNAWKSRNVPTAAAIANASTRAAAACRYRIFAQKLGTVLEREVNLPDAVLDIGSHRRQRAPSNVDRHVHARVQRHLDGFR